MPPASDHNRKPASRLEKNLVTAAKGGSISFLGKLFQNGMSIVFVVVFARLLGVEQYGIYKLVVVITTIAAAVGLLGMEGGIKRFLALAGKSGEENRVWGIIQVGTALPFLFALLLSAAIALGADPLARHLFDAPDLAAPLRLAALAVPFLTLAHSLAAVATGFKRVEYEVYAREIAFHLIKLFLAVGAIALGFGLLGVMAAYIIAAILAVVLLLYFVNRLFSLRRPLSTAIRPTGEMLRFSFPLFLSVLLNQFGRRFETLILGIFSIIRDVSVYSAILSVSNIGNMAYTALRHIATPIFAELHTRQEMAELRGFYQIITKWALTFNLPLFLLILIFPESILLIFGEAFRDGAAGMIILAAGTLYNASAGASGALINMSGYSRVTFYNSLAYLAVTLALDFALIPRWGLIGAAWAGALTLMIVNTLQLFEVYRLVGGLLPFNRTFWKPLAAGILSGGTVFALEPLFLSGHPLLQFAVLGPVLIALYGFLILLFGLSPEDRMILGKISARFTAKV